MEQFLAIIEALNPSDSDKNPNLIIEAAMNCLDT